MSRLREATAADRERLAPLRAAEWRKTLSAEQFAERNRRLYRHPFGRDRITTWVWEGEGGEALTSMDTLAVTLRVADGAGGSSLDPAVLIASVITPPAHRGRGHATGMLEAYFNDRPDQAAVLFSDISPLFYERFGFIWQPQAMIREEAREPLEALPESLTPEDFLRELAAERRDIVETGPEGNAALEPEPLLWDWHLERYRYFHEVAGRRFSGLRAFSLPHGDRPHLAAAVGDPLGGTLDILWGHGACGRCREFYAGLTFVEGLPHYRVWTRWAPGTPGERESPMIRLPRYQEGGLLPDVQLGDWW